MNDILPLNDKVPLTILIVEDDVTTSKLIAHHLQKFGKVIITQNAREALANNSVCEPDVIFLDIHYHNDLYNGFDVISNILSINKEAFIVVFSADNNSEISDKALALGAYGFIAKPFHADDLSYYINMFQQNRLTR